MGINQSQMLTNRLNFTGNWFIDVGILGFINLMEEVYGWNLKKLEEELTKSQERVYYGYYPFAYFSKIPSNKFINKKIDEWKMDVKKMAYELENELNNKKYSKEEIFNKVWDDFICKLYKKWGWEGTRLPISTSFYTNFLFFNNSLDHNKQKNSLFNAISYSGKEETDILRKIDKTVNKLLPSTDDFPNIFYTNLESRIIHIPFLFVYLLCFIYGFIRVVNKNIVFYSNDIELCYKVNRRLRLMQEDGNKNKSNTILARIWGSLIDVLVEHKSEWSLQNMYIISYKRLDNQTQEGVEYIGIPKLQATILLDDKIREQLNRSIKIGEGETEYVWILEEFIKGNPLYPHIHQHIAYKIKSENSISFLLYPLIVDAKVLELRASSDNRVFSAPSSNYRNIVRDIKEEVRTVSYTIGLLKGIDDDIKQRKNLALALLDALQAEDKNMYMNILLHHLNAKNELCINYNLIKYLHEKIISNPTTFRVYGLALTMGLLSGGENDEQDR